MTTGARLLTERANTLNLNERGVSGSGWGVSGWQMCFCTRNPRDHRGRCIWGLLGLDLVTEPTLGQFKVHSPVLGCISVGRLVFLPHNSQMDNSQTRGEMHVCSAETSGAGPEVYMDTVLTEAFPQMSDLPLSLPTHRRESGCGTRPALATLCFYLFIFFPSF